MQPSPSPESAEPLLEVLEDLAPPQLHAAAWATCMGKRWYFGHGSNHGDGSRFWKMDLDGDGAFNAIWEQSKARCEALAGTPLRVVRQYANGHTYGLGGKPHLDDNRPGTFTLLYYPNPEWLDGWEGETVFYDPSGEIALAVRLKPNRAVFFDSRILHNGRAPSRMCHELRVTVAYKLEAVGTPTPVAAKHPLVAATAGDKVQSGGLTEVAREGANRVYRYSIPEVEIAKSVAARIAGLAQSVRLPGYRSGQIPADVIQTRYGAQARSEILRSLGADLVERGLPSGSVAASCELRAGEQSGDVEMQLACTHLPDLPLLAFPEMSIERLTVSDAVVESAKIAPELAAQVVQARFKQEILDRLDAGYQFPIFAGFVEREFKAIWAMAKTQTPAEATAEEKKALADSFRKIAERRVRLGLVIAELARRFEISAPDSAKLEQLVLGHIASLASISERPLTENELLDLTKQ